MKTLINTITQTIENATMTTNTTKEGLITMKTQENIKENKKNTSKTIDFSKSKDIIRGKSLKTGRLTATTANEKLQPSDSIEWLLFSTQAIKTCPYATQHCKAECYGLKGVYCMKTVREMLERNTQAVQDADYDWVKDMLTIIKMRLEKVRKDFKGTKTLYVRAHVVGDFYNQQYFDKWMYIASCFNTESDIKFMCYTKSLPYVEDYCKRHNLAIEQLPFHFISSIWDDTKPEMIELTKKLGLGTYSAGLEWAKEDYACNCDVDKCAICRKCYDGKHHITINVDDAKARAKKKLANKVK